MSFKKIGIIVLVLGLLLTGGFLCKKKTGLIKNEADVTAEQKAIVEAQEAEARQTTEKQWTEAVKNITATDKDMDGLSDEEEKKLGTDPNNADTDNDGLFDEAEVEKYKTNPLNPDTDGDGFTDGYEVRRGFNPNGEGKL